jgi:carbonic anhydrase
MNPPAAAATGTAKARTAERHAQKAEALTVADTGSKPRMIELPRIDPSMVDNPSSSTKQAPSKSAKPAAKEAPQEAKAVQEKTPDTAAEKKTAAKPASSKKAAAPSAPTDAPNYHTGTVSRAEIERQLATFGPRKLRNSKAVKLAESLGADLHTHWSYEGKTGPDQWAHLSPDNKTCANGKRQSPIDIRDGIRVDLEPIKFNYGQASYSVLDNGHTIQVNIAEGQSIRIMERSYQLLQFHFHKPAEERVNGRSYDMVAHLVHKDADGRLAVIAVLMEQGLENPLIQTIWNNLPLEQGMLVSPSAPLDMNRLLPEKRDYWTYMGSLTTPPCTEDVLWMVMKQPLQASAEQIGIFGRIYPGNARPIQPSNGRLVKESR